MKYALNLGEDGRILSATYEKYAAENMTVVDELPEGNHADYIYENGEYIYAPISAPEQPEKPADLQSRVSALEEALDMILSGVTE